MQHKDIFPLSKYQAVQTSISILEILRLSGKFTRQTLASVRNISGISLGCSTTAIQCLVALQLALLLIHIKISLIVSHRGLVGACTESLLVQI
jgi:hypothetical protein